ncbi:hypothetical protein PFHG_03408 [Plasmodium falciparum HB3]|uniref:Chaperone DnaJ n=1 Tax=Plasmodium falciparum (isolate HB3) TaxID=137071 RepID=A0A0L7KES8_PLAFX|nr:hypothetical protein PFHG_03408 [Plasmodium falciparum HB3]
MLALRILRRKVCSEHFLFERSFFTQSIKGKNGCLVTRYDKNKLLFYYKRNINTSRKCLNQDPYTVLGLSRNATTNDIKKQFRLLAKKYHPDINPSPDAKQKMASITAAYELLSDPKKKEFYDKTGMTDDSNYQNHSSNFEGAFSGFGDASFMFTDFAEMFTNMAGGNKNTSTRGEDIQSEITLKFMEAIKGCEKNIRLNVKVSCNNCNGSGKKPGTNLTICKVCNGSGIQRMERGPIIIGVPCRNCSGNGQIINNPCKHCSGSGVKFQTKNITLDIPPGIKKGMQMRIPNQGHCGYRGGKSGHLFVTINIEPHKIFKWVDDNIYVDVPLTIKQCLLGGLVTVPTLNGDMDLLIKPKTYPNSEKILKGKGPCKVDSHNNGDLIIKFSLKIPEKLTPRQVELIEEFNTIELNLPNPQTNVKQKKNIYETKGNINENIFSMNNTYNNMKGPEGETSNTQAKSMKNQNWNNEKSVNNKGTISKDEKKLNMKNNHINEKSNLKNSSHMDTNKNEENIKNSCNIPIPPPPPKSSSKPISENQNISNREHNGVTNNSAKLDNNINMNYSCDPYKNVTQNDLNNNDNIKNKIYKDNTNISNHHIFKNDNINQQQFHCADNSSENNNESDMNTTSTFSFAKKWISDKLKPKN